VAPTVPPCACQGVEVGRGHPHEAALIEGVAGGRERGDGSERGPRSAATAVEPQQVVAALTAAMTTTVPAPSIPLAPAPIGDSQAAVVEIPDEDVPPPGWDQWVNLPAPAPEPPTGVLVVRDDGGMAPG
jgi:hypothetical protein